MSTSTSRSGTAAAALILIMLLSSLLGAFQPDVEVQEDTSSLFNEDVVLTLAQQGAINRVTGRASTTDFVTTGVPTSGSANSEGDENSVTINSLALKPLGNVVVAGSLRGEVHFDSLAAVNQDHHNAFVAELTPYGTWQWLSQTTIPLGAADSGAFGLDVTVSSSGEIFLVGVLWNAIEFGTHLEFSNGMSKDGFIAKLDSSGDWKWSSTFGGTGNDDSMNGVAVDSNGDAYVVGAFRDHAYFNNSSYNHQKNEDAFVTKVNRSSGEYEWVSFGMGNYDENGTAIVIDGNDRIFATGYYHGAPVFGSTTLANPGSTAAWIGEMDLDGTWQWVNEAVTTFGAIIPLDITYSSAGIYICGAMSGLIQIDGVAHWANSTGSPGWNAFVGLLHYNG
ncbi:MAG: SBBP repeat-containing protein, partial [Candidatus Poseidoniales archaeon]|nr:SBBP repeat-containing protein [Candidatus Poseidoniales archaeon]